MLASVLLLLGLAAWAEDPPGAPVAPAVSGRPAVEGKSDEAVEPEGAAPSARELRRMRRAERRARRRAGRGTGAGSPGAADEGEEEGASQTEAGGAAAVQSALKMGEALKGSLKSVSSAALPETSGRTASPAIGAGPAQPPPDPSQPRTEAELIIAVQSGYRASPAAVGLVMARDASGAPVLKRADGRPPTQEDLAALRRHIESEPRALMRRPDFFQVLPRQRYQELKQDFRGKPQPRAAAFQDVDLTERDRDFVWERTCEKVSGGCNPSAREGGYKKDAEVAPEDLDGIWKQIYGTADTFLQAVVGQRSASPHDGPRGVPASLVGRILDRVSAFRGWLSGEEPGVASASEAPAVSAQARAAAAGGQGRGQAQASVQAAQAARAQRGRRRQAGLSLGLLAAGALFWLAWRRGPRP